MKFTANYLNNIRCLKEELETADAIVIGAGAGLSTAAGFTYSGERFEKYFSDFIQKYGFRDMYSGGFSPFELPEEHWAYWSRYPIFVFGCHTILPESGISCSVQIFMNVLFPAPF